MNKVQVSVTKEHIEKGTRCQSAKCPVALALNDAGFKFTSVGLTTWCDCADKRGWLPREATTFIENFDNGKTVEPFTFEVEVEPI